MYMPLHIYIWYVMHIYVPMSIYVYTYSGHICICIYISPGCCTQCKNLVSSPIYLHMHIYDVSLHTYMHIEASYGAYMYIHVCTYTCYAICMLMHAYVHVCALHIAYV